MKCTEIISSFLDLLYVITQCSQPCRDSNIKFSQILFISLVLEQVQAFKIQKYDHHFECEVKWALESITMNKASEGDGIPVELFQILKDDAVKVLHSICQQVWKTQQWPPDWKRSVFIPIPKKGNAKECSNYRTIALISQASKVVLKILQARLQQYMNHELPDVQSGFRKGKGTRDQIANICWIIDKARAFQQNIYFCFIDYAKAFDCVDHNKLWKILQEMRIQTILPAS